MNKRLSKALCIALILACAIIVTATFSLLSARATRRRNAKPQENAQLQIKNETTSIQVFSMTRENSGDQVLVTLQLINVGSKRVMAYTILKQNTTMLTTNGATTGWTLGPGEIDIVHLLIPNTDKSLTIHAAVFEDAASEGNPRIVRELLDYRIGVKTQFQQAIPMLRRLQSDIQAARLATVRDLVNLPNRADDLDSSVAKSEGMKHAKQFILNQLDLTADTSHGVREPNRSKLDETVRTLEKATSRLEN
jgi:hypothetical protein